MNTHSHSKIYKIVNSKSIQEIYKMNLFLTGLAIFFSSFFLLLFHIPIKVIISMVLKSGFNMLIITFTTTFFLKFCTNKFPDNLTKFRIWRFILSFFTAIVIQLILWIIFSYTAEINPVNITFLYLIFTAEAFIIVMIILLLQDFIILRFVKNQIELDNSLLQLRTAEAENLMLKQQIHPHFLFNSLSTLKALYKKDTLQGETYLIRLADFLRLTVSDHKKMVTKLKDELLLCENYLEMQKMRFGDALDWNLKIKDNSILEWYLPSFSIQHLLENAIKHNNFTKEEPLKITIEQEEEKIIIYNLINSKIQKEKTIKSGLANFAERYQLWTGDKIKINNDGILFSVSFKLYKNENSNN